VNGYVIKNNFYLLKIIIFYFLFSFKPDIWLVRYKIKLNKLFLSIQNIDRIKLTFIVRSIRMKLPIL